MSEYANDVLVTADWVEEHLDEFQDDDPEYRLVEVDVDTEAYDEGHAPGAIGFNWETQLQDQTQRDILEKDPNAPVLGNPNGDVTIVEFFDYNCPYCRRVKPEIEALIAVDPNVRLVYREWPILSEGSVFAAQAALAARKQGLYEEFHWALMGLKGRADEASVMRAAEEDEAHPLTDKLSPRELEVLEGLTQGKSNKEIARDLDIREPTVKLHMKTLSRKIGVSTRTQAAIVAKDAGLF